MSSFTQPPKLTRIGKRLWRVDEAFEYHIGYIGSGFVIRVDAGFETDLTSVPRWLQWLLPPDGPYAYASVLHDYMYKYAIANKLFADVSFLDGMTALGVPYVTRSLMYRAVRIFGRGCYE